MSFGDRKAYCSRKYWDTYINSIISSIEEDKDTIVDLLYYGNLERAEITMKLSIDRAPTYEIKVDKVAEKSPFGEDKDE